MEDPHVRRTPDPRILKVEGAGVPPALEKSLDRFAARDFSGLLGIAGLSDELLRNHFTLYQGYVKAANTLLEELEDKLRKGQTEGAAYAGAKRRFGWEYNGLRLHELYFENLTKSPQPLDQESKLFERIREDFGGLENWEKDFRACGALRGIGWVVTCHDALRNRLVNCWIDEHDCGHLAGCTPILVMDVFEHAFMLDYGVKKADYVETFMKGIHWDAVAGRLP
jgi:Fe-Mn family superoxide dismutase